MQQLITLEELASVLRMSPKAIRNRLHRNPDSIPQPIHIGQHLRWRSKDIDQWIDKKASEGNSDSFNR